MFQVDSEGRPRLFLESVSGVTGNEQEETYSEILSENSGEYNRIDVGAYPPQSFSGGG